MKDHNYWRDKTYKWNHSEIKLSKWIISYKILLWIRCILVFQHMWGLWRKSLKTYQFSPIYLQFLNIDVHAEKTSQGKKKNFFVIKKLAYHFKSILEVECQMLWEHVILGELKLRKATYWFEKSIRNSYEVTFTSY